MDIQEMNTLTQTFGDGWTATIRTNQHDGWTTAMIVVVSHTYKDDAEAGLTFLFDLLTKDRETLIRVPPQVESEQDFNTKDWLHRGFARVIFKLTPGTHHLVTHDDYVIPSLGDAECLKKN